MLFYTSARKAFNPRNSSAGDFRVLDGGPKIPFLAKMDGHPRSPLSANFQVRFLPIFLTLFIFESYSVKLLHPGGSPTPRIPTRKDIASMWRLPKWLNLSQRSGPSVFPEDNRTWPWHKAQSAQKWENFKNFWSPPLAFFEKNAINHHKLPRRVVCGKVEPMP